MTPNDTDKIRLLVLFGGQSAEHDVSRLTAAHVLAAANPERYDIHPIGITRDGEFVQASSIASTTAEIEPLDPAGPTTELGAIVSSDTQRTVVLPLLHGPLGEDGTVQGLCELADVAYVGAGVLGSAVTMDKAMAKTVLDASGIEQTAWLAIGEDEIRSGPEGTLDPSLIAMAIEELGLPLFVKPANMGSSVGVSKASTTEEFIEALETAFGYDEVVVVEEAVEAREIELAVLGNQHLEVSVPGEIIPGADFYDYDDKYHDGNAKLVIPAELPEGVDEELQQLAIEAYRALRVEGMARADFLYEEGGRGPLLNELNTIPGFTPISMYPKLWEASGLPYTALIDRLVELALERHERRSAKRGTP